MSKQEEIKFNKIPTFDILLLSHIDFNDIHIEEGHLIGKLTKNEYDTIYDNKKKGIPFVKLFNKLINLHNFKIVTKYDNYTEIKRKHLDTMLLFNTANPPKYSIPTELNIEDNTIKCYSFGHKITDTENPYDILKYKLAQLNNPEYFIIFRDTIANIKELLKYNYNETTNTITDNN